MSATNLNRLAMVLAFAGIFVAGFLTLAAMMRGEVPCISGGTGCQEVANHPSAKWFNQPVAYYGLAAYLGLAFLAGLRSTNGVTNSRAAIVAGTVVAGLGTALSAYLTYVAIVEIKATCEWCLASAVLMTASLVVHLLMLKATDTAADPNAADIDFKVMIGLGLACTVGLVMASSKIEPAKATVDFVRAGAIEKLSQEELVPRDAHILGNRNAPITIVEFADLTCRTCRQTFSQVEELIKNSNGKYRLVFRHLPLPGEEHKLALPAAIMAEMAAEQGGDARFFQFISALYGLGEAPTVDDLWELCASMGLKREDVEKRISSKDRGDKALLAVQRDLDTVRKFMKELATPTYIVFKEGGSRHIPRGLEDMKNTLTLPEFQ